MTFRRATLTGQACLVAPSHCLPRDRASLQRKRRARWSSPVSRWSVWPPWPPPQMTHPSRPNERPRKQPDPTRPRSTAHRDGMHRRRRQQAQRGRQAHAGRSAGPRRRREGPWPRRPHPLRPPERPIRRRPHGSRVPDGLAPWGVYCSILVVRFFPCMHARTYWYRYGTYSILPSWRFCTDVLSLLDPSLGIVSGGWGAAQEADKGRNF